jgi:hypothetical protein
MAKRVPFFPFLRKGRKKGFLSLNLLEWLTAENHTNNIISIRIQNQPKQ